MKKLEMKQMEGITGGKFWGTGTIEICNTVNPITGADQCQTCLADYMFWIQVDVHGCGPVYEK